MKILHCIPNLDGGGAERQLVYLTGGLIKLGVEVHVYINAGGANLQSLEQTGARIHLHPTFSNHSPLIFWRISKIIKSLRPDVVQTWFRQMDLFGGLAAIWYNIPWILSERAAPEFYPHSLKDIFRDTFGKYCSAVIANSNSGKRFWEKRLSPKVQIFERIPNIVPLKEIEMARPIKLDNLSLESKKLLCVARLVPGKNYSNLLEAISLIEERTNVHLLIAGEGPLRTSLQNQITRLNLTNKITLLGYRRDIWSLMKSVDMVVFLSNFEGMPNAVLEAIACRVPLLLSDIPAHRELLAEDECFFIKANAPHLIADQISASLENSHCWPPMVEKAFEKIKDFGTAKVSQEYLRIYQELKKCNRLPGSE